MNRLVYFIPIAVFSVLAMYFVIGLQHDPKILPSALIDKPVPEFNLAAIEGHGGSGLASGDLKKGSVSVQIGRAHV